MKIDYDPVKNQRNIAGRGLSFERAIDLDWPDAVIRVDDRKRILKFACWRSVIWTTGCTFCVSAR
jgi:uncharacterized DUF497 family protein